jgi:predicted dehydrogenase
MTVRVGVCGLGFMGRTHLLAYAAARAAGFEVEVTAVADRNAHKRRGELEVGGNIETGGADGPLFDPDTVAGFEDPFELVRRADVDLVSICTHTPSHVDLAIAALENGKHVLVEKPVALASADVERLVAARDRSDRFAVPGMCIRHWPGWRELKQRIVSGDLGALRSLAVRRLSPAPGWGARHYADATSTGGALFDLHVHDADFVHWCLGAPARVRAAGTRDHVFATYAFDAGPGAGAAVSAEGGWDLPGAFPFHMGYLAVFEGGTLGFDSAAGERAFCEVRAGDEAPRVLPLESGTGYEHEVRALLRGIAAGALEPSQRTALDDAVAVTRTLEAEARCLDG